MTSFVVFIVFMYLVGTEVGVLTEFRALTEFHSMKSAGYSCFQNNKQAMMRQSMNHNMGHIH